MNDVFRSLREQVGAWLAVHLGSLPFIGLTGAVLFLLLRDLRGPVTTLGRVAVSTPPIGPVVTIRWRCRSGPGARCLVK